MVNCNVFDVSSIICPFDKSWMLNAFIAGLSLVLILLIGAKYKVSELPDGN